MSKKESNPSLPEAGFKPVPPPTPPRVCVSGILYDVGNEHETWLWLDKKDLADAINELIREGILRL